ncbi:MAG: c-type cytochrome, partial [Gallionellaceae bacterium]|nr:c-type cytochrome [Gallionellaceae bacterium]
ERVFKEQCGECHSAEAGHNRKGPTLFGVVGRTGGSVADYDYSDAMKANAETWTEARLDQYIAHPRRVVHDGRMKYDGLADTQARSDLIAYLASLH